MPTSHPGPGTERGRACGSRLGEPRGSATACGAKQTFISGGHGGWESGTQELAGMVVVVVLSAEASLLGGVSSLRLCVLVSS